MKVAALVLLLAACSTKSEEERIQREAEAEIEIKANARVLAQLQYEYNVVKERGDKMEMCVRAGAMAEALLSARLIEHYDTWKKIAKADCKSAGIPVQ